MVGKGHLCFQTRYAAKKKSSKHSSITNYSIIIQIIRLNPSVIKYIHVHCSLPKVLLYIILIIADSFQYNKEKNLTLLYQTNLSVRGVITRRPELPRYSYPYQNWVFVWRMVQSSDSQYSLSWLNHSNAFLLLVPLFSSLSMMSRA